jgi:hypothetical protein
VDIRVVPKGQTFEALIRQADRKLKAANRRAVAPISRAGIKAVKSGAPTFQGKQLSARIDPPTRSAGRITITFYGVSAGAWAINETGAVAHDIFPRQRPRNGGRRKSALKFPGAGRSTKGGSTGYALSAHHPGVRGRHLWTAAGKRIAAAVAPVIDDVYGEALN